MSCIVSEPEYSSLTDTYIFNQNIETDDIINIRTIGVKSGYNTINLSGDNIKPAKNKASIEDEDQALYGLEKTKCKIFTFIVDEDDAEGEYAFDIGGKEICVFNKPFVNTNEYEVEGGLQFFINYTSKISSKLTIDTDSITLTGVPVIKNEYMAISADNAKFFIDSLETKRNYMDNALKLLEDSFEFDFKFYNTYGPGKLFKIDGQTIDRTNIELQFEVKLKESSDKNIRESLKREIKSYIENLNEAGSIHISNLIYHITSTFQESIYYIEFVKINDYATHQQYLEKTESEDIDNVPEFLNIDINSNNDPMITISLV